VQVFSTSMTPAWRRRLTPKAPADVTTCSDIDMMSSNADGDSCARMAYLILGARRYEGAGLATRCVTQIASSTASYRLRSIDVGESIVLWRAERT